jgi:hypothetical protein
VTEAEDYEVSVALDDRWFELPVGPSEDVDAWAVSAVDRALALRGVEETPGRRRVWQQMFAAEVDLVVAEVDEHREVVAAYLLVPAADIVPVTTVALQAMRVGPAGVEGAVAGAVVPEQERYGAPEVEEVETRAGTCVRVRQVLLADEAGALRNVVVYVWDLPEPELVLVGSAVFGSPSDAAVYGDAVDDLAMSLRLAAA